MRGARDVLIVLVSERLGSSQCVSVDWWLVTLLSRNYELVGVRGVLVCGLI